jgi:hypothetical protein
VHDLKLAPINGILDEISSRRRIMRLEAKAASAQNRNHLSDRAIYFRPWGWNGILRHVTIRK